MALFLLGALPLPAIMLAYLFHKGALDAFVFWTIRGSMDYVAGGADSISLISQTLKRGLPFVAGTLVLWVFVLARTKKIFSRSGGLQPNEWLVWFWLFLSFAPVLAGKRLYGHYFLMLVPPLSVIAAVQFDVWWSACASRFLKRLCVGFIILAGLGCLVPRFFLDQVYKMTGEDNPNDHVTVAEYIKAHTAPEDRVLVWGFAPLVYFYSERMPASRFFWSDLMAGRVPASKQKNGLALQGTKMNRLAWEMFFEDAKRGRPVYFIDTSPAGLHDYENFPIKDYPELSGYLRGNFAQEATVNGAVIYRSNGIIP